MDIVRIHEKVDTSSFSVNREEEDADGFEWFLKKRALDLQNEKISMTYVALENDTVVGYFALSTFSVRSSHVRSDLHVDCKFSSIPGILLGKIAVDRDHRGKGIGDALLDFVMEKSLEVSEIIAARLLVAHPIKLPNAIRFYERNDFRRISKGGRDIFVLDLMAYLDFAFSMHLKTKL